VEYLIYHVVRDWPLVLALFTWDPHYLKVWLVFFLPVHYIATNLLGINDE